MDFYKNLPAPARIGIPVAVGLALLLVVYLTVLKAPAPVVVVKTQDVGVYQAAQQVLEVAKIPFEQESDATKSSYTLKVAEPFQTAASDALGKSGIKDLSGKIANIECPAPPGFTATKKANERADNCEDAKSIQNMLITAGASAANVKVSQMANETLLGPESSKSVMAQVFLPPTMEGKWASDQAARAIATAIGTSIDNVAITNAKLEMLFDGSRSGSSTTSPASGSGASTLGSGCGDMATATEIATKEAAVRNCYKDTIGKELNMLLGGSDRYVLTVGARVDAKSRTATYQRNKRGAVDSRLKDSGGGRSLDNVQMEPDVQSGSEVKPAGDISMLALTVALDSNFVDSQKELAVKRLLSTYVDPRRKDPAPKVTRFAFTAGTGKKPDNSELETLRQQTVSGAVEKQVVEQKVPETPTAMYVLMGLAFAGMLLAFAILWRRSTIAAAERARYEQEFSNQQRVLDTYARQDPGAIARDLEKLLGTPPAQERAF